MLPHELILIFLPPPLRIPPNSTHHPPNHIRTTKKTQKVFQNLRPTKFFFAKIKKEAPLIFTFAPLKKIFEMSSTPIISYHEKI